MPRLARREPGGLRRGGGRARALGVAVFVALLAASSPAAAAPKRITGKLSKPGYTVIGLNLGGQAKAVRAISRGRFRLTPPASPVGVPGVTLHLRAPNGSYAGPIVVGGRRTRAILGVKPGARLGRVRVRRGHARVAKPLRRRWLVASRTARARRGVPLGARGFGRVRSSPPRRPVPGDTDFDGVPDQLDIDDDGDLVLDDLDRSSGARAAQEVLDNPGLFNVLELSVSETVNANAGSSDAQIEQTPFVGAVQIKFSALLIGLPPEPSTELDCGRDDPQTPAAEGLPYCRPGGSGMIFPGGPGQPGQEFPECCDSDGDGFGTLVASSQFGAMGLHHSATTAQIKTGDVLIKRVNDENGVEVREFPHALQYVFATVPALESYSDTAGNLGRVSYPIARGEPPPGQPGGPGTQRNAFPVEAGPDGRVVLNLTFWQPQRRPIEGEPGYDPTPNAWIDIGGLTYSTVVDTPHDPSGRFVPKDCPQDAYSIPPDQPFTLPTIPPGAGPPDRRPVGFSGNGLTDTLADRLAHPDNKLTYTLDLTRCLDGHPWRSGESVGLAFRASGQWKRPDAPSGHAQQYGMTFRLK
jgi:hypothetical protein